MCEVLNTAAELQAYTLTDRTTYIAYRGKTGLAIALEGAPRMFNSCGIIAVNPANYKDTNYKGAMQLIDWITLDAGQKKIAAFKVDGQQLFFPSTNKARYFEDYKLDDNFLLACHLFVIINR